MNLFYEEYPSSIIVKGEKIPIITDFRDYVRLIDTLKSDELRPQERQYFVSLYFKRQPPNMVNALEALIDFVTMKSLKNDSCEENNSQFEDEEQPKKAVYSFEIDYPFIFSAFLQVYGINIRTIPYMHWWEFRLLFEGLPEDTEIKKRIMYRSIDPSTIKDNEERRRIIRIQNAIRLPQEAITDYDIGDAFA